jgi:hypothetical protein
LRIAVLTGIVDRSHGREAQSGASSPDFAGNRGHHLHRQPNAILLRTPVAIGAVIDAVAQELLEKLTIRAVHFNAIAAGLHGASRRLAVCLDNARKLIETQRPRSRQVFKATGGERFGIGAAARARV